MVNRDNPLDQKLGEGLTVIPFPVAIMDTSGTFVYANHSFEDIFGEKASKLADLFQTGFNINYYLKIQSLAEEQVILKANSGFMIARLSIAPLVGKESLRICLIQELSTITKSTSFLQFARDNVGLVGYSLERIGPKTFYIDSLLHQFIHNLEVTLIKMGLYLMTAIGQGQDHISGLFGPLPVPGHDENLAIIYSFSVPDEEADDPRAKDQRYVMLVLVFPAFIEEMINDRIRLRIIFRDEMENVKCFQDLTDDFLARLKNKLLLEDISADKLTRSLERKLSALYQMSQELLESPKNSFRIIMDYVESVLDFKYFGILKMNQDTACMEVVAVTGYGKDLEHVKIPLDKPAVISKCATDKVVMNIPDVKKCDFYLEIDPVIRSELAIPVIMNNRLLGVINAESENPSAFNDSEVQLMKNLAGRVALVFKQRVMEEKLRAVHDLIYQLIRQEDLDNVFQTMIEFADRVLEFKILSILLLDREVRNLEIVAHHGYLASYTLDNLKIPLETKKSISAKAAREGRIVRIGDVKEVNFYLEADPLINSELAVPIKDSEGKVIGVVNAEALQLDAFNEEDEEFMEILAGHIAIVMELFQLRKKRTTMEKK
ncbi:MAG: GAF domain-containing protein [Candidatus Odinarchaeota archaeon]